MSSLNKVFLLGRLGKDPELRFTPSGQAVVTFTLATTRFWIDKQGRRQERTEWHRVVVWGKLAERCSQYLRKGRQVLIEGSLQTRSWEDKDGVKHYTTEVVADNVTFIGSRSDASQSAPGFETMAAPLASNEGFSPNFQPEGYDNPRISPGHDTTMDLDDSPSPHDEDVPF